MTDERLEQIRTAITEKPVGELEHVLPELLDELDRVRGAAESFRSYLDLLGERHNELANRSESARHRDAYIAIAGAIAGIEAQGRTLGLFKEKP